MKKILYFVTGLIFIGSAFVACFDEKDFKFDKFTISDLDPTLYVPLVNDTIRLDANNDYNVLYDEEGVGYLYFDITENILPPVEDFFTVPSSGANVPILFDLLHLAGSSFSTTISNLYPYVFSRPDQQIDSIIFKEGTLSLSINTPASAAGSYTLKIPKLRNNNGAFSEIIPFGGTSRSFNLSGYALKFEDNNSFEVTIGVEILSSALTGQYMFNSVSFSNVKMKEVYGYFGQHSVSSSPVSIVVPTFDKFRNNNTTELRIKEAFLDFRVNNGAGFPIRLRIDTVTSISGGLPAGKAKIDSALILPNEHGQLYSSGTFSIGREAFGEVLSNMPSEVKFEFSATINPEGNRSGTVKNFLTDAGSITVSDIQARIPLNFSVRGMVLKDTLNFSASRVTFNDMELLMNVENNMPVEVALRAFLIDGNDSVIGDLFSAPVFIPAATVDPPYEEKIEANVESLAQTKKIRVEITVNSDNSASEFVRVTKDNYVYLKIGARAKVNIDNLD